MGCLASLGPTPRAPWPPSTLDSRHPPPLQVRAALGERVDVSLRTSAEASLLVALWPERGGTATFFALFALPNTARVCGASALQQTGRRACTHRPQGVPGSSGIRPSAGRVILQPLRGECTRTPAPGPDPAGSPQEQSLAVLHTTLDYPTDACALHTCLEGLDGAAPA